MLKYMKINNNWASPAETELYLERCNTGMSSKFLGLCVIYCPESGYTGSNMRVVLNPVYLYPGRTRLLAFKHKK